MEDEDRPTSMVYDHCVRVFKEMQSQARAEEDGLIYEGHLTKLFANLQLPTPYYTTVMNHLKSMNCVEQLRRGGGNSPSRWVLIAEPNEEAFKSIENVRRRSHGKVAGLEQQVRDLTRQVNALTTKVTTLESFAVAFQRELKQLTSHHNDLRHVVDRIDVEVTNIHDERQQERAA